MWLASSRFDVVVGVKSMAMVGRMLTEGCHLGCPSGAGRRKHRSSDYQTVKLYALLDAFKSGCAFPRHYGGYILGIQDASYLHPTCAPYGSASDAAEFRMYKYKDRKSMYSLVYGSAYGPDAESRAVLESLARGETIVESALAGIREKYRSDPYWTSRLYSKKFSAGEYVSGLVPHPRLRTHVEHIAPHMFTRLALPAAHTRAMAESLKAWGRESNVIMEPYGDDTVSWTQLAALKTPP